jgi:DivIVA domain-containing protein
VNGGEALDTRFATTPVLGYHAPEVDELLRRVAAELDSGRSARPLIENATFQVTDQRAAIPLTLGAITSRYDIDAVDWFLGQLSLHERHPQPADMGADPWRDLPVTQLAPPTASPPGKPSLMQELEIDKILELDWNFFRDCQNAWRGFGRQPGGILRQRKVGHFWAPRYELHTADQNTIASCDTGGTKKNFVRVGGRRFAYRTYRISSIWPGPPVVAEIADRSARDFAGHFSGQTMAQTPVVRELVDESGTPILYISGKNYNYRACACITFADRRRLRFLVRGTQQEDAIMTAVDESGNKIARYRHAADDIDPLTSWDDIAITVHPGQELTDELALAIAISTQWLDSYFTFPQENK